MHIARVDKEYLIVGGHGFIGSYLCKRLIELGSSFDIYDINEPNGDPKKSVINYRRKGLPESKTLDQISENVYEKVIHLGSYAGIRSGRNPLDYFENNVLNLQILLNELLGFRKLIYISSSSVLGDVETAYSLSKKIAEQVVSSTFQDNLIIRPFTVYGKGGRPEMLITKLVNGEKVIINGDPEKIRRRFTYVEDLIDCILVNENEAGIINAIGGHSYKLSDLLDIFGNEYTIGDESPYDFKNQTYDHAKDYLCKTMIEDVKDKLR